MARQEEIHLLDKVVQKVTDLQKKEDKNDTSAGQWVGARSEDEGNSKKKGNRVAGSIFAAQGEKEPETDTMTMVQEQYKLLDDAGLSVEALSTWKLSPLEFDQIMNRAAAVFIIGPANHGIRCEGFLRDFVDEVEKGYSSVPYHNWFHAVDVAHATWRLANLCNVIDFLEYHETLAVLVAALAHDLGHPGVNSRFLIETKHTLAMTYNDRPESFRNYIFWERLYSITCVQDCCIKLELFKICNYFGLELRCRLPKSRSPLQQMSSAKLFEITKKPHCGIFSVLSRSHYMVCRKACIQAILATDTALHFQNVKKAGP